MIVAVTPLLRLPRRWTEGGVASAGWRGGITDYIHYHLVPAKRGHSSEWEERNCNYTTKSFRSIESNFQWKVPAGGPRDLF